MLNHRKVIVAINHERTVLKEVMNPRSPELIIVDNATGAQVLERAELKYDPTLYGPEVADLPNVFFEAARAYCRLLQKRGQFLAKAPAFSFELAVSQDATTPSEIEQTIREFYREADQLYGALAIQPAGVALATGFERETVREALDGLVAGGELELTEAGYQTLGVRPANPWQAFGNREVQQELGLQGRLLRVMVAGPGDTAEEATVARQVIEAWNLRHAEEMKTCLLFKHWTEHSYPNLGQRPQAIINSQLAEHADILVAIFWNRLGLPTGTEVSGTVEELKLVNDSGKPVLLYFSSKPISHDCI